MSHSILITGASGYLGGSLLSQLHNTVLPAYKTLYALVRSKEQAAAVKKYGAEPLTLDLQDQESVVKSIINAQISIIYFLVDAMRADAQIPMIKALAEVKKKTGREVHFLHTSGAKIFSEHAGMATDRPLCDNDPGLYGLQKCAKAPHALLTQVGLLPSFEATQFHIFPRLTRYQATNTNNTIIATASSLGVRSYIFIPCIVYGEGKGFGNNISIQTTAVVKTAKGVGATYDVNPEGAVRIPSPFS
jgi:hypothetical protein